MKNLILVCSSIILLNASHIHPMQRVVKTPDGPHQLKPYPPKKEKSKDKPFHVIPSQINAQDASGNTALIRACRDEQFDNIQSVLAVKANPDVQNKRGNTALILTVASPGRNPIITAHICEALIDANANLDLANKLNYTALMMAAHNGYIMPVKLLINARADITHQRMELVPDGDKQQHLPHNAADIAQHHYFQSQNHFAAQAYFTIWNALARRQNKIAQQTKFVGQHNKLLEIFKQTPGACALPRTAIATVNQYCDIESDVQSNLPAS